MNFYREDYRVLGLSAGEDFVTLAQLRRFDTILACDRRPDEQLDHS